VGVLRHLLAILLLPFVATVIVPVVIVGVGETHVRWWLAVPGAVLIAIGLALMVSTVRLFATVGRGTLAPWDPTSHLVVEGPYRRVRNPMINGVLFVLVGEAAVLGSLGQLIWAAVFLAVNAVWMPLVEEPGLVRRFGGEYETYRENVPAWLPRPRPWQQGQA